MTKHRLGDLNGSSNEMATIIAPYRAGGLGHRRPAVILEIPPSRARHPFPLLVGAQSEEPARVENALFAEEAAECRRDKEYWLPLRRERERLRHAK